MKEIIICVDKNDKEIGFIEKMDAHIRGILHRAISVFIFNDNRKYNGSINFNTNEVENYKWISLNELKKDIKLNPQIYTFWFIYIMNNHINEIEEALNRI